MRQLKMIRLVGLAVGALVFQSSRANVRRV